MDGRANGGIAKWTKATDCKSVIRGFESHCRLLKGLPAIELPLREALKRLNGKRLRRAREM